MSNYPDKFPRSSFTSHISITHEPSGFKFYQQAGRIIVLRHNDQTGFWGIYSDFTNSDLQITGTHLTEAALIRAAIVWLKDTLPLIAGMER